ncbi:kinase-like domain-containing protein [Scenedesmus sp. NREL 46B-D3]|nr:kinase-like domain-containing protein [Scenedesmus sp. NREL 46B-D3]
MHRRKHAMYADGELHVLCLELALHLLSSPSGMLDPLQLPQDPTDNTLQRKVLVLVAHLAEPENAHVAQALADRAYSQQQQQQQQQQLAAAACGAEDKPGAAAATVAGLAACTLRLLKLLSPGMFGAGRLQLGGMIQQGAFSEVHAATLLHAGKPMAVAVKLLAPAENDASCFERIHNEVAILEKLQGHAGVVPLLDYGVMCGSGNAPAAAPHQQPQWALVFPRYSGSLRAWRQQRGRQLQLQDVALYLRVFLQVASTVSALHASNIVHYDIKGDNLLLDTDPHTSDNGSSSTLPFEVVLADFGDALMFDAGGSAFAQRHRGTELFSSPEMLLLHAGQQNPGHEQHDRRRHRGVGRAHDVWSLGCTLYELLTGRVLFEQEGVGRITACAPSSGGGGTTGPGGAARGGSGSVLGSRERAALAVHPGLVDLVEFMLVNGWEPQEHEQALAPSHAVAAPDVLLATELEHEQQQQQQQQQQQHKGGAAQHVPRGNASAQRQSLERMCRLQPPPKGLPAAAAAAAEDVAAAADAKNSFKEALARALEQRVAQLQALLQQQEQKAALLQQQLEVADQQMYWQHGHTQQLVAEGLAMDELIAELRSAAGSQEGQLVGAHSAGSARTRISDAALCTAVDAEAAAIATIAAADSAAASAAAACVESAESSWLYDQKWVQPLQTGEAVAAAEAQQQSEQQVPEQEMQPEQQVPEQEMQPEQQLPQLEVQPEAVMVTFSFRCVTQPGEELWLVGDAGALGSWDPAAGTQMQWGEGHIWSVTLPFEQGATLEYKAVLQLRGCEPKHWRWQAGCNCVVEARNDSSDGKPLQVKHDFH